MVHSVEPLLHVPTHLVQQLLKMVLHKQEKKTEQKNSSLQYQHFWLIYSGMIADFLL